MIGAFFDRRSIDPWERKKRREEKALEKELKKDKAKAKEAVRKLQEQANSTDSGKKGKNNVKRSKSNEDDGDIDNNAKDPEIPYSEKKLLSLQMDKHYNPSAVEKSRCEWWEIRGLFMADAKSSKPPFVMLYPPPNVTGVLHLGHALTAANGDTIIRWRRMSGDNTLYQPGMDHAGIATQVVVEKKLMSETGKTRHDLGRDEFVKQVWEWKKEHGGTILQQLRRLGASLDFSRESFTMDEKCSKAVVEAFVRLYNKGLIYRDNRIVNWDCSLKTAISEIEVDSLDIQGRTLLKVPGYENKVEFGLLTTFAYHLEEEGEVLVATTRIETMLGDTGIAVHPDDKRYKHLHGKHAIHPFSGRRIPIICDAKLVDPEFGTGAVKITPAHDPNDFEVGKRHNLEFINIFTDDGEINQHGGEKFAGMPRYKARDLVTEALKEKGLYRKTEVNEMKIKICSRSNDVVEPMMKPQWYVKCSGMAHEALISVEEDESNMKKLEIIPKEYTDHWKRWLENIRDWCISRQLWWGHRIPAWYAVFEDDKPEDFGLLDDRWVVARNLEEARAVAAEKFGQEKKYELSESTQDPDVLDTWFSSALFPLSVFGWPDDTEDFKAFYPSSLLETGHDILFFWVARMVMLGITLGGEDGTGGNLLPFPKVYLHPMIRDAQGRKMSKSLGNVIDPVDVINGITLEGLHEKLSKGNLDKKEIEVAKEGQKKSFPNGIKECGADALRFALIDYTAQSENINLDIKRVVGYRHWCNKLWNAVRFAILTLGDGYVPPSNAINPEELPFICQWILSVLNKTIDKTVSSLESYKLSDAAKAVYSWWQYQLCDIFIEGIKPFLSYNDPTAEFAKHTLWLCLDNGLRLLHPFMPFITEELWQRLHLHAAPSSIMVSEYPSMVDCWKNEKVENEMDNLVMFVVNALRSLAKGSRQRRPGFVLSQVKEERQLISTQSVIISQLTNVWPLVIMDEKDTAPTGWAVSNTKNFSFYLN
ncbi:putative valine--tRNA ligase [Rosa chinensis]|uniref:Valine--tRNA ligase, mitochondrial n=1 Tax=Rosa chinensis TaxID=74649 RepID=A0A2P6PFW8_ROSCH|nr:valine--tRNA ligase, mitochondrial 1 [Rosa chinensis]PRQ20821.1 putative valine--tRNA ligase [Rosa chinensis]